MQCIHGSCGRGNAGLSALSHQVTVSEWQPLVQWSSSVTAKGEATEDARRPYVLETDVVNADKNQSRCTQGHAESHMPMIVAMKQAPLLVGQPRFSKPGRPGGR
jgi:hypothetical protein